MALVPSALLVKSMPGIKPTRTRYTHRMLVMASRDQAMVEDKHQDHGMPVAVAVWLALPLAVPVPLFLVLPGTGSVPVPLVAMSVWLAVCRAIRCC